MTPFSDPVQPENIEELIDLTVEGNPDSLST